jgi:hypothetical protein
MTVNFSGESDGIRRILLECKCLVRVLRDLSTHAVSTRSASRQRIAMPLIARLHELLSFLIVQHDVQPAASSQ